MSFKATPTTSTTTTSTTQTRPVSQPLSLIPGHTITAPTNPSTKQRTEPSVPQEMLERIWLHQRTLEQSIQERPPTVLQIPHVPVINPVSLVNIKPTPQIAKIYPSSIDTMMEAQQLSFLIDSINRRNLQQSPVIPLPQNEPPTPLDTQELTEAIVLEYQSEEEKKFEIIDETPQLRKSTRKKPKTKKRSRISYTAKPQSKRKKTKH